MNKTLFFNKFNNINPSDLVIDSSSINHIFFESISMQGLEEMHHYSTNKRLYEHLGFEPFETVDETRQYLLKLIERVKGGRAAYWFVRRKKDNRLIGTAGLLRLDLNNQSVEWGFGIDPELWGQGFILQIMEALKYYVFKDLELNRLYGTTFITNKKTIASLKATGMSEEGILREFIVKNNKFIDGWKYSMLSSEYFSQENNLSLELEKDSSKEFSSDLLNVIKLDQCLKFLSTELKYKGLCINDDMSTVPKWDSLTHITLMLALETKFKIKLSPIEITQCRSVELIFKTISLK